MALTFDLIYANLKDENAALRKAYTEQQVLIRQLVEALCIDRIETEDWPADSRIAIDALRARLERP